MDLRSKIKNIIRWARITASGIDTRQYPVQQVEYKGKVGDCLMIFPYGHHANLTPESLVAMFAVEGDPNNRAGIGWTPTNRPVLAAGEICIYHPPSGSIIKFNAAGGIDITAVEDVTLTAQDMTINLDNLNVNCSGTAAFTGALTSNGKDISDGHAHSGVMSGGSNTGPVV